MQSSRVGGKSPLSYVIPGYKCSAGPCRVPAVPAFTAVSPVGGINIALCSVVPGYYSVNGPFVPSPPPSPSPFGDQCEASFARGKARPRPMQARRRSRSTRLARHILPVFQDKIHRQPRAHLHARQPLSTFNMINPFHAELFQHTLRDQHFMPRSPVGRVFFST